MGPQHREPQNLAGPCAAAELSVRSNSWMVTKLPRLFDIFSPSTCRKPLCIQTLAMRRSRRRSRIARSRSRGAGRRGRSRRRGCRTRCGSGRRIGGRRRTARAASPSTSPSIRYASRAPRRSDAGRARPARLVGLRGLPQHEIHRVALVGRDIDARARQHLVERAAGERAIARRAGQRVHRRGREQHVILGDIGDAAGDQPLDHRPHRVDMLGGARLVVGGRRRARRRPRGTGARSPRSPWRSPR